jgi:ligand-binding sensor domain-containing protein
MFIYRSLLFLLLVLLTFIMPCSQSLYGQREQPLLLSGSSAGAGKLMLGAVDRLVISANGRWQEIPAPDGVLFSPGAWLFDGDNLFAGTNGFGLYKNSSPVNGSDSSGNNIKSISYLGQKNGLAGNIVTALEKVENNLWVGTDGGLSLIEGGKVISFSQWNSDLPGGSVSHLLSASSGGGVWVVTREGGALVNKDLSVLPWSIKGTPPPAGKIMDLALWDDGGLVVAGINSLYSFKEEWSKVDFNFTPVSLLWIPSKGLLMSTVKGLFILEDLRRPPKQVFTTDKITSMALSGDGLWITTDKGVRVAGSVNFLPDVPLARDNIPLAGDNVPFAGDNIPLSGGY